MGVTALFYAATASIDQVETALRDHYAELLGTTTTEERAEPGRGALEQIYKNEDAALVVLWRDGSYTCWAESEFGLCDAEKLAALSTELGTVLCALIGDHGGSYSFGVFRDGREVRWIQNDSPPTGTPIPEEANITPTTLRDVDVETIWERFGLKPYFEGVPPFRALLSTAIAPPIKPTKRWYQFWR